MTQTGEPVINVTGLKKHYGDVKAVDGVSFEVGRGEVFGMGPNGAGKTTTIEVLEACGRPTRARSRSSAWTFASTRDSSSSGSARSSRRGPSTRGRRWRSSSDLFRSFYDRNVPSSS